MAAAQNLLLITVEGLRPDHLAPWGAQPQRAPTLSLLARAGTVIEDCSAPSVRSRTALDSLLTGALPAGLDVGSEPSARVNAPSLIASFLAQRGPRARSVAVLSDAGLFGAARRIGFQEVLCPRKRALASSATQEIDALAGRPWALWLQLDALRRGAGDRFGLPWRRRRRAQSVRALYLQALEALDARLARFIETLEGLGELEDALIVLSAGRGERLYAPEDHGACEPLAEDRLRVPVLFYGRGIAPGGRVRGTRASVDVAPTTAALLDLPPSTGGGDDLSACVRSGWGTRSGIAFSAGRGCIAVKRDGLRLIIDSRGVRGLYDVEADPEQRRCVRHLHPVAAQELEAIARARFPSEAAAA